MAKTTTRGTTPTTPRGITRGDAVELIESIVRNALREQARDLEKHLNNIHTRLVNLETR